MLQFYRHFYLIFGGLCSLSGVFCALYPTRPVASTVLVPGQQESVTWTDNRRRPRVHQLGLLSIQLHTQKDVHVSSLAESVNPESYGTRVILPCDLKNDTLYLLRFSGPGLRQDVYTADFSISSEPCTDAQKLLAASTSTSTSANSSTAIQQTPNGIVPVVSTTAADALGKGASGGYRSLRNTAYNRFDLLEKAEFWFLFILWPALIGILMAL